MKTIRCPQCGLVNFSTAVSCKRCNYFFQEVNLEAVGNQQSVQTNLMTQPQQNFIPPNSTQPTAWTPPNQYQPNYQTPHQQNYRPGYQNSPQKKRLAIYSMIFGILSFPLINFTLAAFISGMGAALFGVPGAIVGLVIPLLALPTGLITGITALVKANKRPNEYGGKGFAITGIVLSGFAIIAIPLVAAIAIPNLLAARRSANEGSAIALLRIIAHGQFVFWSTNYRCGELSELGQNKLIDPTLISGTKSGYSFTIIKTSTGCDVLAKPVVTEGVSASGNRSFYYSSEEGKLRESKEKTILASKQSPILEVNGFPPPYSFLIPKNANIPPAPVSAPPPIVNQSTYSKP